MYDSYYALDERESDVVVDRFGDRVEAIGAVEGELLGWRLGLFQTFQMHLILLRVDVDNILSRVYMWNGVQANEKII